MPSVQIPRAGLALFLSAGVVVLAAAGGWTQTPAQPEKSAPKSQSRSKVDSKINDAFKKPNVRDYLKKFESEKRENYAHRHEIVAALDLKPGMAVADVGAGTGFFSRLFAEKVGPTGKVYAVDIAPRFLEHIAAESRKQGHRHVVTILGSQDSTNLPRDSVDLVFLSDVYHHFENPDKTLASIHQALRPGGRLVVIEFDRVEGKSSAFVLKHVRASQAVFRREIESAGFTLIPTPKPPPLKENFFLRFEKSTAPAPRATPARSR
jgi:ubiquinone/menaquinone biosynthesis C-methylase UbiE